ncbi:lysoplasmalogenase [Dactylosporangium sp. CA-052675]|uniref:lysoplasmalogenase n=1 Tax=Dactylosporangium sp. CA-052675 TaxID=3239927 RepID=UPI003D9365C8
MKLKLFWAAVAVELIGVATDQHVLQWIAKPLIAPLLLWYLHRRGPIATALVFATVGDIVLLIPGRVPFLLGLAAFLGTQIALLTGFLRRGRPRALAVAGYAVVWAGVNAALWGQLGALRGPVLGYSLALAAMACAATGVNARTGLGGALFLVSDLLIGVGAAGLDFPGRDLAVMATYVAALYLIVTAAVSARAPEPRPAARR